MSSKPRLVQHVVSIHFSTIPNIRRYVNDLEDALNAGCPGGYTAPQTIPVPDEIGPEVPRVIFTAKSGFSQIQVSLVSIALTVNYSEDWQVQLNQCLQYIQHRVHVIFDLIKALHATALFSGVSTRIRLVTDLQEDDPVREVSGLLAENVRNNDINEVMVRWSKNFHDIYFRNIVVQTFALWQAPETGGMPRLKIQDAAIRGIEITSDANDRRGYNEVDQFTTSLDNCLTLIGFGVEDALALARDFSGGSHAGAG